MTLGTFTPRDAYAHTWQYEPAAVAASLVPRFAGGDDKPAEIAVHALRVDINTAQWTYYANALGLSSEQTIWKLWPEEFDDEFDTKPELQDILKIDDDNEWVVTAFTEQHWGPLWIIAATKLVPE